MIYFMSYPMYHSFCFCNDWVWSTYVIKTEESLLKSQSCKSERKKIPRVLFIYALSCRKGEGVSEREKSGWR